MYNHLLAHIIGFKWSGQPSTPSSKVARYFSLSFERFWRAEKALHMGDMMSSIGWLSLHVTQAFFTVSGSLKFQPVLKSSASPGRRSKAPVLSVKRPGLNTSMTSTAG